MSIVFDPKADKINSVVGIGIDQVKEYVKAITIPTASAAEEGVVKMATAADIIAAVDETKAINSKQLAAAIANVTGQSSGSTTLIQNAINTLQSDLSAETQARINADNILTSAISPLSGTISGLQGALNNEITARTAAVSGLTGTVNSLSSTINGCYNQASTYDQGDWRWVKLTTTAGTVVNLQTGLNVATGGGGGTVTPPAPPPWNASNELYRIDMDYSWSSDVSENVPTGSFTSLYTCQCYVYYIIRYVYSTGLNYVSFWESPICNGSGGNTPLGRFYYTDSAKTIPAGFIFAVGPVNFTAGQQYNVRIAIRMNPGTQLSNSIYIGGLAYPYPHISQYWT